MGKSAKVFMNGRSQAIRLPKEYRFDCDEVYVERQGDSIIISAVQPGWDEFFDAVSVFDDDFLADRKDLPPQDRSYS